MSDQASIFRQLHHQPKPLVLANVWDAGSARLVESLGAPAIATSSAAVAWALGYRDGGHLPVAKLCEAVANIVAAIKVPLSVDMEDGYDCDPLLVGENCKSLLDLGVAGINIEDGNGTPLVLAGKIEKIKETAVSMGTDIFVNARADVYLQKLVPDDRRVEETISRGRYYKDAGADGFFVPALVDAAEIRQIAAEVGLPLNVLAWPGLLPVAQLGELGVRRLSAGSGISKVLLTHLERLAKAFLETGDSSLFSGDYWDYSRTQALFG